MSGFTREVNTLLNPHLANNWFIAHITVSVLWMVEIYKSKSQPHIIVTVLVFFCKTMAIYLHINISTNIYLTIQRNIIKNLVVTPELR